jgi:hypothetical protein
MKFPLKFKLPQTVLLWGLLVFFSFCIVYSFWVKAAKGLEGFSEGAEGKEGKLSSEDIQKIVELNKQIDSAKKQIEEINKKAGGPKDSSSSSPSDSSPSSPSSPSDSSSSSPSSASSSSSSSSPASS